MQESKRPTGRLRSTPRSAIHPSPPP
jgi:hypothetical protein